MNKEKEQVDIVALRTSMQRQGLTNEMVADHIGISRDTLQRRLRNRGATLELMEIWRLVSLLSLSDEEIINIFFGNKK